MSLAAHPERPFDLEDLIAAPDDGYRYEVLDGALVVNAAPTWRHQEITLRLSRILQDAAPPGVKVLPSPVRRIGPGQVPEPDVVVVAIDALGEIAVEGTPMLVVEVLSPSNRDSDLVRKRALYAEAGCPATGSSTRWPHRHDPRTRRDRISRGGALIRGRAGQRR